MSSGTSPALRSFGDGNSMPRASHACAATVGDGAAGVLIALVFAVVVALSERTIAARSWAAAGMLWIALPCVAILWLDRAPGGRNAIFLLLAVIVFGMLIRAHHARAESLSTADLTRLRG